MKKYIRSYDGLRVIALVGVVLYHLIPSTFKGGYLGVVTFFVMAGYLTTNQAMRLGPKDDRPRLVIRKIRDKLLKLYPALIAMLSLVAIFVFFFLRADLGAISGSIKTSLLSIYNYGEIFSGKSYFESTGRLAPFNHLWALSLEIQVYILFFVFLYGSYRPEKNKNYLLIFFILSILSQALAAYLIYKGSNFTRVYYDSFTRLYSFLIGGMAALVSEKKRDMLSKTLKESLIFILLLASIGSFFVFDISKAVFYYVFPLYSLLIAGLMILLRHSEGIQARFLSGSFFSLVAKRSYHIYLWHFPVLAIQEKMMAHSLVSNGYFYVIFFLATLILSEISYRGFTGLSKVELKKSRSLVLILLSFIILFSLPYEALSDSSEEKQLLEEMKATILENERIEKERLEKKAEEEIELEESKNEEENSQGTNDDKKEHEDTEEKEFSQSYYNAIEAIEWVNDLGDESLYLDPDVYTKYRQVKGVLIGDSLSSMSYHTLYTYMPNFVFDSDHSRQMKDGPEAYRPYLEEDNGDYLVLSLGTNGDVLEEDMDALRELAEDKSMILSTIVLPYREQEKERNENIRSFEALHDNVYLSDWYGATKNRPELFFDDKIHTGERGARIMSQLIIKKIIEIESSN